MRQSLERTEVYRFRIWVLFAAPLAALSIQTWLPTLSPLLSALDLTLAVTVYFAIHRRSQIGGLLLGALIGLSQDALGSGPIGAFGLVKTIIGYTASSLGARFDVDNAGFRGLAMLFFYYQHLAIYLFLNRVLLDRMLSLPGLDSVVVALVNAAIGVIIFALLDRLRERE